MKSIRIILSICLAAAFVCMSVFCAAAEESNVVYIGNSGELIFKPGSEYSPTDLFGNFKDVMPGDSLSQKITVKNNADDKVKVKIYLRSLGSTDEKYNKFLNQLKLTVSEDNDTPMFDAAADKTAGLTNWVCLGTLYSGGEVDLNVTLDVPTSLDNMFRRQIGKVKWQFVAQQFPIEEIKWECPKDKNHPYHIENVDGVATYICDGCDESVPMKCKECGGRMHEGIVVKIGGDTYTAYIDGDRHYKSKDGKVHFYMDEGGIIKYYVVGGRKINVKSVNEYVLYSFYECIKNGHHTEPTPPPYTGESGHSEPWVVLLIMSGAVLIVLFVWRRKRKNDEKARAKC